MLFQVKHGHCSPDVPRKWDGSWDSLARLALHCTRSRRGFSQGKAGEDGQPCGQLHHKVACDCGLYLGCSRHVELRQVEAGVEDEVGGLEEAVKEVRWFLGFLNIHIFTRQYIII